MKQAAALLALAGLLAAAFQHGNAGPMASVGPDEALRRLMDGNTRFVAAKPAPERQGAQLVKRRDELANGQSPFAVVVCCSDSRVSPELIFDQTLGDIFVVRTAGEVVDPVALGSAEYAVEHLGSRLIVVLGHKRCGAVAAAVSGSAEPGHIPDVLKAIQPAVDQVKGKPGDMVDNAVRAQALDVVKQLQTSGPIISSRAQSRELRVVGAYYDLDTGKVELLKP
jgi:carbonic anhydrase